MIPLPVILVEFLMFLGLSLVAGLSLALVRLRRDGNWPPAAGAPMSAGRIVGGIVLGLVVTLWAVGTWVSSGFSF